MTVATEFHNWQHHTPAPDPKFNHCSPNVEAIVDYLGKRWAMTYLGCYGWRPVRGGSLPSSHGFGAAEDRRYDVIGRARALSEVLPWLIAHSQELHIQAIHDYVGSRIWRTNHPGDGWRAQTPEAQGGDQGMGQAWAAYFHIETNLSGWHDTTPVADRPGIIAPPTIPPPVTIPGGLVHATIRLGDQNADVYAMQMFCKKYAGNTDIVIDGKFGPVTDTAIRMVQTIFGLTVDGIAGPATWAKVDAFANTN